MLASTEVASPVLPWRTSSRACFTAARSGLGAASAAAGAAGGFECSAAGAVIAGPLPATNAGRGRGSGTLGLAREAVLSDSQAAVARARTEATVTQGNFIGPDDGSYVSFASAIRSGSARGLVLLGHRGDVGPVKALRRSRGTAAWPETRDPHPSWRWRVKDRLRPRRKLGRDQVVPDTSPRSVNRGFLRRVRPGMDGDCGSPAASEQEDGVMTARTSFRGSFTALVTPFKNGSLDEKAFRGLVDWQIVEGTRGLVPVGTTGESPTLSHDEHRRVVQWCIQQADGRVRVIAGAGSNSTAEAIEFARHEEEAGADAVLVVTPYYNKPTQDGLYRHFKAINDAIGIPLFIYNIPPRSVIDMSVDAMRRLFELENVAGEKEATAMVVRVSLQRQAMGSEFNQLSGEDASALGFMAHGGHGCISVTANVAPRLCAAFQVACLPGDYATALALQDKLMPLHTALILETTPAPA